MTHAGRPDPQANLRDLSGAAVISAADQVAFARGPMIDELVDLAQEAGLPKASRRTVRGLVERGLVAPPRRVGRSWRYQNLAMGQVDVVSRHRSHRFDPRLIPVAVFVETGSGNIDAVTALACELLGAWHVELAADLARLQADPAALTAEVARAARMRRDAPLPRRVRMRLEDRELAILHAFARMLGTPLSDEEGVRGGYQLERILGLRSGRAGRTRDLSDLMPSDDEWSLDPGAFAEALAGAGAQRIELARRVVESALVWMPALRSVLLAELGPISVPIVDILATWSQDVSPSLHLMMLGAFVHRGLRASDDETRHALDAFTPETFALALLADRPPEDWKLVIGRLRPYQRLRFLAVLRSLGVPA